MTTTPARMKQADLEELILTDLAEGHSNWAIAEGCVDKDVSNGEYEGCSSDLEGYFAHYENLAARIREQVGG